MRNLIFFFSIILIPLSLASQKEKTSKMNIPVMSKESEKFEFHNFREGENVETIIESDGKQTEYMKFKAGYSIRIKSPNSYYIFLKSFYENGMIKRKGVMFNSGDCPVGIWYNYNDAGKLTETTNHDSLFRFQLEDLIKYLTKEGIPLTLGIIKGGIHTEIYRVIESNKPLWKVRWSIKHDLMETLTIDGNTGKVIKKEYMNYSNS
jgi:hypothetical protein